MLRDLLLNLRLLVERLEELDKKDAQLRAELAEVGRALVALAEEPGHVPAAENVQPAPARLEETPPVGVAAEEAPRPEVRAAPTQPEVQRPPAAAPGPSVWLAVADEDLPIIEERCRLKAAATRFAAAHQRALAAGDDSFADFKAEYHDLIARAKALPDCFLWMCRTEDVQGVATPQLDDLAAGYETAVLAIGLVRTLLDNPDRDAVLFEQALHLTGEAQSAIWKAIADMNRLPDSDQHKLYYWLKDAGARHRVWFERFMKREDPADPARWSDLRARLLELESRQQTNQARERQHRKLLGKVRYHLKRLSDQPPMEHDEDWQTIIRSVAELVQNGLPPSNLELRDLLQPVLDEIPEGAEMPREFQLVLREIDRYLALRPTPAGLKITTLTDQTRQAARLLHDNTVVLIGGQRRPGAKETLEEAFGLAELIWLEGRDQSHTLFAPYIARPDVTVVLLAIRWCRHGFGEVKQFCDQYGKPLVRLPTGYNPNQVAHQILTQVGEQLVRNKELVTT